MGVYKWNAKDSKKVRIIERNQGRVKRDEEVYKRGSIKKIL